MKPNQLLKKFGDHVRKLRTEKGLSPLELAKKCKAEENYILRLEKGEIDCPIDFLIILSEVLEVGISDFFRFESE
jgi:ribosome-binding protein aMBF1 (putative translation factor)